MTLSSSQKVRWTNPLTHHLFLITQGFFILFSLPVQSYLVAICKCTLLLYIVDTEITSADSKHIIKAHSNFFCLTMNVKNFPSLFDPKSSF